MANKTVIAGSSVTAPQLKDFFRQIDEGSITGMHLQALLEHCNPFGLENIVIDWKEVYRQLGMSVEIGDGVNDSRYWTVPVFKGVTINKVVEVLRVMGVTVYLYVEDLDKNVVKNDRDPANGDYQVKFLRTVEADPELQNKSAEMLAKDGVKGITLLERLLLELGYFLATGEHLDVENVTLCSGSRRSDGVPYVHWSAGGREVYVHYYRPTSSDSGLRSRAVVS
jgi:membrane-bound inhibitor of C-type lysozyme